MESFSSVKQINYFCRRLTLAALALPIAIVDAASGATWVWTGNSAQVDATDTGFSQLFGSGGLPVTGSRWNAGLTVSDRNWSVNGTPVMGLPGPGDSVVFGPDFPNGPPLSGVDRTIYDVTFDVPAHIGFDFQTDANSKRTLTLESGRLTRTSRSYSNQLLWANVVNSAPATWDIGGADIFQVSGDVATSGSFTKTGPGYLAVDNIFSTGQFAVADGNLAANNIATNSIVVGDGVGSPQSAIAKTFGESVFSSVTINSDGLLVQDDNAELGLLILKGGGMTKHDTPHFNWRIGAIEAAEGASSIFGADNNVILNMEPGFVDLANPAIVVQPASSLTFNHAILKTDSLTLRGGGTLRFEGSEANQLTGMTTVEAGNLVLNRTESPLVVGSVTLGRPGAATPATLTQMSSSQIADSAYVTLHPSSAYNLSNGISETIQGLRFFGGSVSTGTATLNLLSDATDVGGTNAVSTLAGSLDFGAQTHHLNIDSTSTLVASARIGGASLTKSLPGTFRVTGSQSNQLTTLTLESGVLELDKTDGLEAIGGALVVGNSNQIIGGPTVRWISSNQLSDNLVIDFRSGTLDLNGKMEAIGGFQIAGSGVRRVQGAGIWRTTGKSVAMPGAHAELNALIDLGGGVREFEARGDGMLSGQFTNWTFSGPVTNGTLRKTGVGRIEFRDSFGDAVLDMAAGSATIASGSVRLGGLEGAAPVNLAAALELDVPAEQSHVYAGRLSGPGNLLKTGQGVQQLAGAGADGRAGNTVVLGGTLELNKSATAVNGNLTIDFGGRVKTLRERQLSAATAVSVKGGGVLDATAGTESIGSLSINGGSVLAELLGVDGDISMSNGSIEARGALLGAGSFDIGPSSFASVVGGVAGDARLDPTSTLSIPHSGPAGSWASGFVVGAGMHAKAGSTIRLTPGHASDAALLTIQGGLLIGTPLKTSIDGAVVGMSGKTKVDLSQTGPLTPGVYNLIDFSHSPYAEAGVLGSAFPTLSNFVTIAPSATPGEFSVVGNVLQFRAAALAADFDEDGDVDGADLVAWKAGFGTSFNSLHVQGDADSDRDVDGVDFLVWQRQFGGSDSSHSLNNLPEPTSVSLLLLGSLSIRRRPFATTLSENLGSA